LFNACPKCVIVKAVFINLFDILPQVLLSSQVSGPYWIGIGPDIRYPAFQLAGYPAKTVPVSGASLTNAVRFVWQQFS
jgi:hypothetical protein